VRFADDAEHVEALAEAARCLALLERDMSHAAAMVAEGEARAKLLGCQSWALTDARGRLQRHLGELDQADENFAHSALLARAARQAYAEMQPLIGRFEVAFDSGRYDRALDHAEALWQLAAKTREGSEGPYAALLLALARMALSRDPTSGALEEALEEVRRVDAKHRLIYGLTRAALLACERKDPERAIAWASEALDIARLLERSSEIVLSLVALSRAYAQRGDLARSEGARTALDAGVVEKASSHARRIFEQRKEEE